MPYVLHHSNHDRAYTGDCKLVWQQPAEETAAAAAMQNEKSPAVARLSRLSQIGNQQELGENWSMKRDGHEGHMLKQPLLRFDILWKKFAGWKRFNRE
ncbi:unnamed protein product [Anisakis simplex]|uniref:Uncharacterized protein n=1 Tax=Anisakis simplex TaxID=6269 RepID=A0A0M3JWS5_ANISI|nr:unnamed protein product [Anisakis simplex]